MQTTASEQAGAQDIPVALLVEDDVPVRELTARMLLLEGYTVVEAGNGAEALAAIDRGTRVDVVVTDLLMPVMDGYQLLQTVGCSRRLPCVAMTATLTLSEEQEKRLGGAPLLYKPFTMESFVAAIRAARYERPDFSYEINAVEGVVSLRTTAIPAIEEKIAIVNRIWADPQYRRGFSIVIDRRGHSQLPAAKDARAFWRYLGDREVRVDRPSRWAIVADRPSVFRFYQSLESVAAEFGVQMKAFQDYDLASQWAIGTR